MASDLFNLFRDTLKSERDLSATDPLTLENISEFEEDQEHLLEQVSALERVELKVDYSDFSNFVFFNSALDYFNITGEKLLNEYPFNGTISDISIFTRELDGYQKHVLKTWPSNRGYLEFDPSVSTSYVTVEDVGIENSVERGGILNPGSGSLTVEAWFNSKSALTGTEEVQILVQKLSGSASLGGNYTLYLTGSDVVFSVRSGSILTSVSASVNTGEVTYVAAIMDRSEVSGTLSITTGSQTSFPVLVDSSNLAHYGDMNLASSMLTMASGEGSITTGTSKNVTLYSGSLDDVRIWKKARALTELSGTFNIKQHAQTNLVALYRFNSPNTAFSDDDNKHVNDYSGHNLSGEISDYVSTVRAQGTLLSSETPDPITNVNTTDIYNLILEQQASGSLFDRNNANKITNFLPESYFTLEEIQNTEVLKNFLYITARHYDGIKLHIDQFVNILSQNYGEFNQTPDALLNDIAQFFGWEFTGNFLNADAFQYLLGKNVLKNNNSNDELDTKLFEIKNQFWKRMLLNLMYMYKTKGTKESIKSLLRVHGLDNSFVRIKEFGNTPDVGIITQRISAEKSVYALGFGSGSLSSSIKSTFNQPSTGSFSMEGTFRFPLSTDGDIAPTTLAGTLFSIDVANSSGTISLAYEKDSLSSHTGALIFSSSDGTNYLTLENASIFNNTWQHISIVSDASSGSFKLSVQHLDTDTIDQRLTSSLSNIQNGLLYESLSGITVGPRTIEGLVTVPIESGDGFGFDEMGFDGFGSQEPSTVQATLGSLATPMSSEFWAQEIRFWDRPISQQELDDHTMNFQSYGSSDSVNKIDDLKLHYRLNENENATAASSLSLYNIAPGDHVVTQPINFLAVNNQYKIFLNEYNYIASLDFGWNDDKIRIYNSSEIKLSDSVNDAKMISLEFNMIDALNEDITQMMSSLDVLNETIGQPTNKYRISYEELEILRDNYFKRLQGRLNFRVFADMLEFFDRSFIDMVRKLIPARATFIGDEFVVESHMLERPKVTYERRKIQDVEFTLEGSIEMWSRFRD